MASLDSFKSRKKLTVGRKTYHYFSLKAAEKNGLPGISQLPFSMKVLLENLLRFEDGRSVTKEDIEARRRMARPTRARPSARSRSGRARVLMQDFTGVPAVVDLAAMRDAMTSLGGDPQKINPLVPVDLVIDHSVIVDAVRQQQGVQDQRRSRIWPQRRALPLPEMGPGIVRQFPRRAAGHRHLPSGQSRISRPDRLDPQGKICAAARQEAETVEVAYPDTLVGTDSHTTMVNGLSVLGWGVGGIEAEACMLGQPLSMLLPEVIGFKLTGRLEAGVTATDLVLTVTQMLRKKGVVGKFVEFYGPGLDHLSLADRATIANMAPEYGATCGFFPVDSETIAYLDDIGAHAGARRPRRGLCEGARAVPDARRPRIPSSPRRSISILPPSCRRWPGRSVPKGGSRSAPSARVSGAALETEYKKPGEVAKRFTVEGKNFDLGHGDVVIAAITSCTNTSNPSVLIGAGLLARNAVAKGLGVKPWVKTSLAPGSQVVAEYLAASGLQKSLDKLGFNLVGFGCTTCIGNSGPLAPEISKTINDNGIVAAAVLSGNRNFEGRVSPDVQANYLASPPLVVAHALAGTVAMDLDDRSARPRQERQSRLSEGHLAERGRDRRASSTNS